MSCTGKTQQFWVTEWKSFVKVHNIWRNQVNTSADYVTRNTNMAHLLATRPLNPNWFKEIWFLLCCQCNFNPNKKIFAHTFLYLCLPPFDQNMCIVTNLFCKHLSRVLHLLHIHLPRPPPSPPPHPPIPPGRQRERESLSLRTRLYESIPKTKDT